MKNSIYLHHNNSMTLRYIDMNPYLTALIGAIATLTVGILSRLYVTTYEKKKFDNDQLLTNSITLGNHTKIISDLQAMVQSMMLNEQRMNGEITLLRTENQVMRDKLDTTTNRVEELEKENTQVKKENEILISKLNLNKI